MVDVDDLLYLDIVWEDGFDDDLGTVPARTMTDRAISVHRSYDPEQMIVHYIQPHSPYIHDRSGMTGRGIEEFQDGKVSREEAWEGYLDNLRYVLNDVELLLENIDAEKVIIISDHGEAFGEWGFYDHTIGCPHPAVRKVPWVQTSATDTREYEPTAAASTEDVEKSPEQDLEGRLKALGYR